MANFNTGIIFLLAISIVTFYILKAVLNSIIKGFLYTALISVILFFIGMVYFLGFNQTLALVKSVLSL